MDTTKLTALVVMAPEAEPVVAAHRDRLDAAASYGIGAHVTVLFPFLPPADVDDRVIGVLTQVAAATPAFFLTFSRLGWFGDRVVWLAPDPPGPFRELTAAVTARFPAAQPYGGQFDEVIPHLTLGHDHPLAELTAAADAVLPRLPIRARATTIRLITGRRIPGETWTTLAELPLG
ncbi:MAG: 2'-5' RNA ligase family protein [Actinoplanes sp.]